MKASRDPDLLIEEFLADGIDRLPDRSYDVVRSTIEDTRQRVVIGPWRNQPMARFVTFGIATAVVVLVAVVGIRGAPMGGGMGVQPTASPTVAPSPEPTLSPTATPSAASSAQPTSDVTPIADPSGRLQPGTYVAHPFDRLLGMDARAFSFTTPSANWEAVQVAGKTVGLTWNDGNGESAGVGLGFLKVDSLNGDACHWVGTSDDVQIGPTVDDLLRALANAATFRRGDPYADSVANAIGQGVELTMPTTLEDGDCDERAYRIWNAQGFDIYAQGPSNAWRLGVFEVDRERYVVLASYMPNTPDEVRDEMMSIFRSIRIGSSPGCPSDAHLCN